MRPSLAPPITVQDVDDVLASLAFEGGSVSDATRELFIAVAHGELTMEDALARHRAAQAA